MLQITELLLLHYSHVSFSVGCHGEPLTDAGKHKQLVKIMFLVFVPTTVLLAVGGYYVVQNTIRGDEINQVRAFT